MSWLGRQKEHHGIVTVLDIGSSKICCVIAQLDPASREGVLRSRICRAKVLGIGHQKSQGIKSGVVVDPALVEKAVRLSVDAAERMAGLTVDSIILNLSAGRLQSEICSATVRLGGRQVVMSDISRVCKEGTRSLLGKKREIVHSLPLAFSLDSLRSVRSPYGMVGDVLGVDMHVLTADPTPRRNLELVLNRSHLVVDHMVATPYASALSTLVDDERETGATCIDMGGGTTSVAMFSYGKFIFADSIALGGNHITFDLARGLSISLEEAERLKVMYASVMPCEGENDRDILTLSSFSGVRDAEPGFQVPRSFVTRIVRARVDEILEMLRDRLVRSGYAAVVGKCLVLTGGASQLVGMAESVRRVFGCNVRIGRPLGISGLPQTGKGPAFSTVTGLVIYPQVIDSENRSDALAYLKMTGTEGPFHRVSQWIKERF